MGSINLVMATNKTTPCDTYANTEAADIEIAVHETVCAGNDVVSPDIDNIAGYTDTTKVSENHPGTVDNPFLFNGTKAQLEKFFLTCVFVAGKNATVQQSKVDQFVECVRRDLGEDVVDTLGVISAIHHTLTEADTEPTVLAWLKEVKSGQYTRIASIICNVTAKVALPKFHITNASRKSLAAIRGIGYKTASFFKLYTTPGWQGAVLDTHILKYMKEECNTTGEAPPNAAEYIRLEDIFLTHIRSKYPGRSIPEIDFEIWSKYRSKTGVHEQPEVQAA